MSFKFCSVAYSTSGVCCQECEDCEGCTDCENWDPPPDTTSASPDRECEDESAASPTLGTHALARTRAIDIDGDEDATDDMASALELPLAGSPDAPASTAADIPSRSASTYLEAPDRERPTDAASSVSQNLTVAASPDCLGPTVAAFQDAEHAGNVVNVEMNMPKRNDLPPVTDGDDSDSSSDYKPLRCGPGVHCLQRANNPMRLECGCHFSWDCAAALTPVCYWNARCLNRLIFSLKDPNRRGTRTGISRIRGSEFEAFSVQSRFSREAS
jgi:hypothetical protein